MREKITTGGIEIKTGQLKNYAGLIYTDKVYLKPELTA
jgi:hypothetical protein